MTRIVLGAAGVIALAITTAAIFLQIGGPDFAADNPHSPVVHRLIEWAREKSITRRAADIVPPDDLYEAARIRRGAGNYDAMCANCHLSPGVENTEIRKGLYPTPPNLAEPIIDGDAKAMDARRFWIIKHGIKASGMPAWSKGGMEDESIWDMTAFLKAMPSLSADDYRQLVKASDGHSHRGMDVPGVETNAGHTHHQRHDAKPHFHKH